jgi:hypothetical protein
LNAGKFGSDRTPGRARLSAGCRPLGSRDRTEAAPQSYLLDDLPRAQLRLLCHDLRTDDGFARSRNRLTGLRLDGRCGANHPLEVPIWTSSPLLSKLSAIRVGSRETGADAAAFAAPNADTLYATGWIDVGEEPRIRSIPNMKGRYFLALLLSGWTNVFWVPGSHTIATARDLGTA